jgi:lipoyl(octanoyl) transferase
VTGDGQRTAGDGPPTTGRGQQAAPGTRHPEPSSLSVRDLGLVGYAEALDLQATLVEQRRAGAIGDTLLLLEHPPVITRGVRNRASMANLRVPSEELDRQGIQMFETGRGGDITYHGPGQLIGYPILDLRPNRCDVHQYVRDLEEVLIRTVGAFGVNGTRVPGLSGVWVGPEGREEKVAAIGVRISRWVTSHGFALNVSTNLQHFELIVPCGISDRTVTSLDRLLGTAVAMSDVRDAVVVAMRQVFAV